MQAIEEEIRMRLTDKETDAALARVGRCNVNMFRYVQRKKRV